MKPEMLKVDRWNPDRRKIERAAKVLLAGGLVAFPTETVYGLGANGLDQDAALKIFAAKGRPADNPLILHFADPNDVYKVAFVDERARSLMDAFWPGPLTLVLPAREVVPSAVSAGLPTVGVRMPSHPVAAALIQEAGVPIAAPSANRSGRPSPTEALTVASDLGDGVDIVIDGGPTDVGLESTVIDATGKNIVLLRPGGLPVERLIALVGKVCLPEGSEIKKRSPGTRYRHYAPLVPLALWRDDALWGECHRLTGYVGMKNPPVDVEEMILFSSPEHYARGLFSALRELERRGVERIVAEWPSEEGIGLALQDRLRRAAGK